MFHYFSGTTLVYSAARRQVGDHHRAQEVTQSVFVALARKAGTLAEHPVLAAWLFRSTRLSSAKLREADFRRLVREDRSARDADGWADVKNAREGIDRGKWECIAPCLDEVLAKLRAKDREAVVLRFFQQRSYAEIGAALGMGESAARMRTERALEKLRAALLRRGVRSTAEALAAAIGAHGVTAAPLGTETSVLAVVAGADAATKLGAWFTLLFMGKMKIGAVAVVAAGLASLATHLALRPEGPDRESIRGDVRAAAEVTARPPVNAREARVPGLEQDATDLRTRLAEAAAEFEKRTAELERANRKLAELRRPLAPGNARVSSSTFRAITGPGEVVVTGGSWTADGKRMFAFVDPRVMPPTNSQGSQVAVDAKLIILPDEFVAELGLENLVTSAANTLQHGEVWTVDEVERVMDRLKKNAPPGADILSSPKITLLAGTAGEIHVGQDDERGEFRGVRLGVSPEVPAEDGTLGIEVRVELAEDRAE
jgi:RNA polymerase sigma factor (sigma-70 family)